MKINKPQAEKYFTKINAVADFLALLSTIAILATVLIQISGRLAHSPAPWTEEATRVFFICMIFLGIGIGFRRAESARVTIFLTWLPRPVRNIARGLYVLATLSFFLFMFYTGVQLVIQQYTMNEIGSAFMIPMWWVGLFVPLSAILGALGVLENLILHSHLLEGGE